MKLKIEDILKLDTYEITERALERIKEKSISSNMENRCKLQALIDSASANDQTETVRALRRNIAYEAYLTKATDKELSSLYTKFYNYLQSLSRKYQEPEEIILSIYREPSML